jgi:hypothetical protein
VLDNVNLVPTVLLFKVTRFSCVPDIFKLPIVCVVPEVNVIVVGSALLDIEEKVFDPTIVKVPVPA